MLQVDGLSTGYGRTQVIWDLSLKVDEGEFVALVGANGAGKTTLLKVISGLLRPWSGTVTFDDKRIDTVHPNDIVNMGLSHIPESRKLFTDMSIRENLEMGAYPRRSWKQRNETVEEVFELFPRLKERSGQLARTLSGGEQQMLAMGRGLMSQPRLVIIDEPSNGLAPIVVSEVFETLKSLRAKGMTILLVEQNVNMALKYSTYAFLMENGRIVRADKPEVLREDEDVKEFYLGIATETSVKGYKRYRRKVRFR
jgi:branched-chain amino acid transport system ATP-binding protein